MGILDELRLFLGNKLAKQQQELEAAKANGEFGQIEILERQIEETLSAIQKLNN
jgi:hypothetical protein